jgi:hypothetical protein
MLFFLLLFFVYNKNEMMNTTRTGLLGRESRAWPTKRGLSPPNLCERPPDSIRRACYFALWVIYLHAIKIDCGYVYAINKFSDTCVCVPWAQLLFTCVTFRPYSELMVSKGMDPDTNSDIIFLVILFYFS